MKFKRKILFWSSPRGQLLMSILERALGVQISVPRALLHQILTISILELLVISLLVEVWLVSHMKEIIETFQKDALRSMQTYQRSGLILLSWNAPYLRDLRDSTIGFIVMLRPKKFRKSLPTPAKKNLS